MVRPRLYGRGDRENYVNRLRYMHTPELEHDSFVLARRKALIATFEAMVKIEINIKDYINLEK